MAAARSFSLSRGLVFELPADWWAEAGMEGFEPRGASYRIDHTPKATLVSLADIAPRDMAGRQHLDFGGFDRERMVRVLRAIALDCPLPPIEVIERPEGGYVYKLGDGTHRFYASVAAGFLMVPTIKGWLPEVEAETVFPS